MKYKVGDRVRIKTWKEIEYKWGLDSDGAMQAPLDNPHFTRPMELGLRHMFPNRILTIDKVGKDHYSMNGTPYAWADYMIDCLVEDPKEELISFNRFEIMDLE
jgi:hypothetical protein